MLRFTRAFKLNTSCTSICTSSSGHHHHQQRQQQQQQHPRRKHSLTSTAHRLDEIGPNVFAEFSLLAAKHNAVNLGQGFPSFPKPDFVKECALEALSEQNDQYSRPGGHPQLVSVLSDMYGELLGRKIDPMSEICTAQGAQLVIAHIFQAFVNPGDEVIVIEPYFDSYIKASNLSGSKVVGVPMRRDASISSSSGWSISPQDVKAAITDRTRMIILNTPHNPVGKMLNYDELEELAVVLRKHPDIIVLSDEVYEFTAFDNEEHARISTLPGMKDRTISVHSAGKTFCATGWRVGYAIGPPPLIEPLVRMQQASAFCGTTPLEVACAKAFKLSQTNGYFEHLSHSMQKKRDLLAEGMQEAGFPVILPQGGFFMMVDSSPLNYKHTTNERKDFAITKHLTTEFGVTCIPPSAFYLPHNMHLADNLLRFCFTKDDESLMEAPKRLQKALI